MNPFLQNKYLETSVQTASPIQLLILLHDGAIRFSKNAIESIQAKKYDEANINLFKVQNIIKEWMITLDKQSPIAETLMPLYEYFIARLIEANVSKDVAPIQEVLGYITELRETWVQASRQAGHASVKHG